MARGENLSFFYNISGPWVYACGGAIASAGNYSCNLYARGVNTSTAVNNLDVRCQVDDNNAATAASLTLDAIRLFVNLTANLPTNETNVTGGTGTTNFTVLSNIILNLNDDAINLGSLVVGKNISSENVSDWFSITNDGSVSFNIYAYGATSSNSPFTSTTNNANKLPNNYYLVHAYNSLSGIANTTYRPVPATVVNKTLLVQSLVFTDGIDSTNIGILVSVPADEPAGSKSAALTLYAEAS